MESFDRFKLIAWKKNIMSDVVNEFNNHFEIVEANSEHLISKCQELRYQIFCREQHIFDESISEKFIETDEYDVRSMHSLLRYKKTGEYAATVRVVLPGEEGARSSYPVEEHVSLLSNYDIDLVRGIPRANLAEISRFSVSKDFRRRAGEKAQWHGVSERFGDVVDKGIHRHFEGYITLGLFKAIVKMSSINHIQHWFAFMEPALIRLLRRVGIIFLRVGPAIHYCGIRHIYYADASRVLLGIKEVRPDIWDFITEGGLHDLDVYKEARLALPD